MPPACPRRSPLKHARLAYRQNCPPVHCCFPPPVTARVRNSSHLQCPRCGDPPSLGGLFLVGTLRSRKCNTPRHPTFTLLIYQPSDTTASTVFRLKPPQPAGSTFLLLHGWGHLNRFASIVRRLQSSNTSTSGRFQTHRSIWLLKRSNRQHFDHALFHFVGLLFLLSLGRLSSWHHDFSRFFQLLTIARLSCLPCKQLAVRILLQRATQHPARRSRGRKCHKPELLHHLASS